MLLPSQPSSFLHHHSHKPLKNTGEGEGAFDFSLPCSHVGGEHACVTVSSMCMPQQPPAVLHTLTWSSQQFTSTFSHTLARSFMQCAAHTRFQQSQLYYREL